VTDLALNDILADSEFVGREENPRHHAPAVVAFHFDEKAGLNVLLHVLNSTFSKAFIVYFASDQVPGSALSLYLQAVLTVFVIQILPSSRLIGRSTAAKTTGGRFALLPHSGGGNCPLALLVHILGLLQGVSHFLRL